MQLYWTLKCYVVGLKNVNKDDDFSNVAMPSMSE